MSDADKRLDQRHPFLLQVEFQDAAEYLAGWTENVSAGGFFLRTQARLKIGSELGALLSFPGLLSPIRVQVQVVWVREGEGGQGVGVRAFTDAARRKLAEIAVTASQEVRADTLKPFRTIIAENNPNLASMYARVLKRMPGDGEHAYDIVVAADGRRALELIADQMPDLLITAVGLPVIGGEDLVRKLRGDQTTAQLPILVAGARPEDAVALRTAGANAVLPRPVQYGSLLQTIVYLRHLLARAG